MPRIDIVTTMWNEIQLEDGVQREQGYKAGQWADLIAQGCSVQRFADSYDSAWAIIGNLPMERESATNSGGIVVDSNGTMNEKAAGVKLNEELNELLGNLREVSRRMEGQIGLRGNPVLLAELAQRKHEIERNIDNVTAQLQLLRTPFRKRIKNFFTSSRARSSESGLYKFHFPESTLKAFLFKAHRPPIRGNVAGSYTGSYTK